MGQGIPWPSATGRCWGHTLAVAVVSHTGRGAVRRESLVVMTWIDGLAVRQRVVLVIALGVLLWTLGGWVTTRPPSGGWYGYAPRSQVTYGPYSWEPATAALIRSALTILWAALALRLLRNPDRPSGLTARPDPDGTE